MRSFFFKIILFSIPILVFGIGLPIYALWFIGDIRPYSQIAIQQSASEDIILYSPDLLGSGLYKQQVLAERQSEILIMGSSRVLTFRDTFCNLNPQYLYNAGIRTIDMQFMREYGEVFLQTYTPDILILALDQPNFNADYERMWPDISFNPRHPIVNYSEILRDLRLDLQVLATTLTTIDINTFRRVFDGSEPVYGQSALGMDATLRGLGYRPDGTFQYGSVERDIDRDAMRYRFDVPQWVFLTGDNINLQALQDLESLLQIAQTQNVEVIVFFPPFEPTSYNTHIIANPVGWTYLDLATEAIQNLVSEYNYHFYDFTNPSTLGITDEVMLDEWHLSERGSLILFQELLRNQPDIFEACTTVDIIEQQLQSNDHPWVIFEDTTTVSQ